MSKDAMEQQSVRLPRSLRERLEKEGGKRGMGEEIRQRLEASFDAEAKAPSDPKTRDLFDAISFCAALIAHDVGNWSEDTFAFEVLKGCVNLLLMQLRPKGDPTPHFRPDAQTVTIVEGEGFPTFEQLIRIYVTVWHLNKTGRQLETGR